ncbi:MAG: UbiA-like polyprenyltransferase [Planctomycetaceae bacterium]
MLATLWKSLLKRTRDLLGLIRFSHTVFALPFALLSALLAWRETPFRSIDLLGIVLCMVFARAAAMAFNRLVDHKIDADNPRTTERHIPSGALSVRIVQTFTVVCSLGFVLSTLLFFPNQLPLYLSGPVLAFLLGYSYAKRFTMFCHYWLSAALMLSPIATWIALKGNIEWPPVLLAAVIFFWVGGFDILYATQDADFDRNRSLFSVPAILGIPRALKLAFYSHLITMACLLLFWNVAGLGWIFLAGVMAVCFLLLYEHWLVRPDDLSRVNKAFFNVNALISLGLLVTGALDIWWFSYAAS